MKFEWDEAKNRNNKAKHGIDFIFAVRVFGDPQRLEKYDLSHDEDEDRWIVIRNDRACHFGGYLH